MNLSLRIYWHPSQCLPITPTVPSPFPSPGWGVVTFCKQCNVCNGNYQRGQVTAAVRSKNITFWKFFSPEWSSGNVVGQDQEFWMTDALKQPFKGWCSWYSYTLCKGMILWDQKQWKILVGKWGIWERWLDVSLHFVLYNLVQGVGCLCSVITDACFQ